MVRSNPDSLKSLLIRINRRGLEDNSLRFSLEALLDNPRKILNSLELREKHPLKIEAEIILDALEAVTNGMYNPEAALRLSQLPSDSVFRHWKAFILAIESFYRNHDKELWENIHYIGDHSPLKKGALVLAQINGMSPKDPLYDKWGEAFAAELYESQNNLISSLGQLEDFADSGFEDLFIETLNLLACDLIKVSPHLAQKICLWALDFVHKKEMACDDLFYQLKILFGKAEGFRLIALSLIPYDIEGALLFWIQALTHKYRQGDWEGMYLDVGIKILLDINKEAEKVNAPEGDPEFFKHRQILLNIFRKDLLQGDPEKWAPLLNSVYQGGELLMALAEGSGWKGVVPRQKKEPSSNTSQKKNSSSRPGQLEFGF